MEKNIQNTKSLQMPLATLHNKKTAQPGKKGEKILHMSEETGLGYHKL